MGEDMTIQEIIKRFLLENKYDGLFNDDCACENADLFPCSQVDVSCEAGFKVPCDCGDHDFHIARKALSSSPTPKPVTVEELAEELNSRILNTNTVNIVLDYIFTRFNITRKP